MCGICGVYNYKDESPAAESEVRSMCAILTHRGPDEDGFHIEGPVGLGMRRLIIIDPETGQQPLYNEDNSIAVVFNGEIYNFQSLRGELIDRGHQLRTRGDGEVIAHLYEELGAGCLGRLRGMFAFALWDRNTRRLLIARDRIGIKPLYYADRDGSLVFGSELKAILVSPGFPRRVDPVALHHYLSLNYVPAPHCLIENIAQLLPGHYLECTPQGTRTSSYWNLDFVSQNSLGEAEWATKVREKLRECVQTHLVSDVPFGAFLSGGIDSSAVVGLMSEALDGPVSTFSIDFAEKSYSEARYAREVASKFGSDHHEIEVTPDVVSMLDTLVWHADDPLADSSMIPVFMIAEFARRQVAMVLTGDGGDEVFAGYPTYNAHFVRKLYRRVPAWLRHHVVRRAVEALPVSLTKVSFDFKAKRFVSGAELDEEEAHFWWRVILSEDAKRELYSPTMRERLEPVRTASIFKDYFRASGSDDPLSRMLYVDTRLYLPADMLVKVDRMTMAHGLEARVPFLDHEMVEFGATIPSSIKFKNRKKKYILKRALSGLVPDGILYRRKAGFNVPVNAWLAGELRAKAHEILAPDRVALSEFFQPEVVQRMLRDHAAKKADHSYGIWGLMCWQLWYERFIAAERIEPPGAVAQRWGLRTVAP